MSALAQQTWLPWPLESRARRGFEELFKERAPPALWPVITRSPVMLWATLRSNNVVALLPDSYLFEYVQSGQLVRVPTSFRLPLAPIGVMRSVQASFAAIRLADFIVARKGQ